MSSKEFLKHKYGFTDVKVWHAAGGTLYAAVDERGEILSPMPKQTFIRMYLWDFYMDKLEKLVNKELG